jgi:ubiquinone/menaquinone biosynthesis C-methylase UbiE
MNNQESRPDHVQNAYNQWHLQVHGSDSLGNLTLTPWHHNVLSLQQPRSDQDDIEIGCGAGDFAIKLASSCRTMTAIDFSSEAARIARHKAASVESLARFIQAPAEFLPLSDNCCDLVYS